MAKRTKPTPAQKPEPQNKLITKQDIEKIEIGRQRASDLMQLHRDQMISALPKYLTVERVMGIALTSMTREPKLLQCTQVSLMGAVLTCCQLGLMMDGILGEAFLVPFRNNRANTLECQLIIGYKGLIALSLRSGLVSSVKAVPVYAANEEGGDTFDYDLGLNEKLEHKPHGMSDPDRITHFYAIVRYLNGGRSFHVMTRGSVELVRNEAPMYKHAVRKQNTIWFKHFKSMGMKTCLRELFKFTPLSSELSQAVAMDELFDAGKNQNLALRFIGNIKVDAEDIYHEVLMDQQEREEDLQEGRIENTKQKADAVTGSTIAAINKKKPKKVI